ncbi:MAG: hypothetical protein K0M50_18525 [Prolixibacteraceae bacterium]|nr:hypothetical protein [Prolixibacteraceae bacterium]
MKNYKQINLFSYELKAKVVIFIETSNYRIELRTTIAANFEKNKSEIENNILKYNNLNTKNRLQYQIGLISKNND